MPLRALLLLLMLLPAGPASAGEFSDFVELLKQAQRLARSASGYAQTENVDLAAVELERAHQLWAEIRARTAAGAPEPFADRSFAALVAQTEQSFSLALARLEAGDGGAAHDLLEQTIAAVARARQDRGITFWADCVDEMNAAMDRLWRWRVPVQAAGEGSGLRDVRAILDDTAVVRYLYERCRDRAPEAVRDDTFRRLFDGAIASLQRIAAALEAGETERFISLLRELRSYDRMLRFRHA